MSILLAHQFIVYVAVIEYYEDYESHIARDEYFYSVEDDAKLALQEMMAKALREHGGEWKAAEWDERNPTYEHSFNNMSAYIRMQVINGPKLGV